MNEESASIRSVGASSARGEISKLCGLDDAVERYVRPGSNIFLSQRAYAGLYAVLRRFWGSSPDFTLTTVMTNDLMLLLLEGGLLRKVITSSIWGARTNPNLQRGIRDGDLQVEMWTIHTIILRLMAGGLGVPFLPTRSILGSSMAEDLAPVGYVELDDPFGSGTRTGLVSALRPDVALVHGLVADPAGNTVLDPDWRVDSWGARASTGGVIVMVEEVISTDALRRYAPLVSVPAHMVDAVCRTPFGAYPQTVFNGWVTEVQSYTSDSMFSQACARALRAGRQELEAWVQEWIIDPADHDAFLTKLGEERVRGLQASARAELALDGVPDTSPEGTPEYSSREAMIVTAARRIAERVRQGGYRFIQTGPGFAALATYLAYYKLQEDGYPIEVMSGFGNFAYTPSAHSITSLPHLATVKMQSDMHEMYGTILRGADSRGIVVLGIAEMDRFGNVNTSRLADGRYMDGSGGHNDCVMGAAEALYVAPMEARRFLSDVSFVTTPGERVRTVVTDLGVLEKECAGGELVLTACQSGVNASLAETVALAAARCGWPLKTAAQVGEEAPPSAAELRIIRALDPERQVLG